MKALVAKSLAALAACACFYAFGHYPEEDLLLVAGASLLAAAFGPDGVRKTMDSIRPGRKK